jgi:DNA-binding response OmpR family regulator
MPQRQRILVIDDDVQVVNTLETLLNSAGYETAHSYIAIDGMELARATRPDLILLDAMFAGAPEPNGFELARLFRQDSELAATPIIMLSGVKTILGITDEIRPDDKWLPVDAFLDKPIRPDQLLAEIKKVLASIGA